MLKEKNTTLYSLLQMIILLENINSYAIVDLKINIVSLTCKHLVLTECMYSIYLLNISLYGKSQYMSPIKISHKREKLVSGSIRKPTFCLIY